MRIITLIALLFVTYSTFAQQNVGIGTNTPHASAVLDVNSNNKGLLMPRLTFAQRAAIANPAEGLMVYQTDQVAGLYIFIGGLWMAQVNNSEPIKRDIVRTSFSWTGNVQNFTVPPFVNKLFINMRGAAGGNGIASFRNNCSFSPPNSDNIINNIGFGDSASFEVNVTPGDVLSIYVGGAGFSATPSNVNIAPNTPYTVNTTVIGPSITGGYPNGGASTNGQFRILASCVQFGTMTFFVHTAALGGGGGGHTAFAINNPSTLLASCKGGNGANASNSSFGHNISATGGMGGGVTVSSPAVANFVSGTSNKTDGLFSITYVGGTANNDITFYQGAASNNINNIPLANTATNGLLSSIDWNNFNSKIAGSGTASSIAFFTNQNNLSSNPNLFWNNTTQNLGIGTSAPAEKLHINGNAMVSGSINSSIANTDSINFRKLKLSNYTASGTNILGVDGSGNFLVTNLTPSGGDNMGNGEATTNIRTNGNYISFDGTNNGIHINTLQNIGISTTASTISKLRVNSANTGTGFTNWIAADFGATMGRRTVIGLLNGMPTIGAHTNSLSGWDTLAINTGGVVQLPFYAGTGNRFLQVDNRGNLIIPSNPNASSFNTGLLSSSDWNAFNNKQNALVNANSTSNGILTATDWNTFNNKQNALVNANSTSNGILTATDWNTFNNKYNLPTLISGSVLFSNGSTIAQNNSKYFWNNTSNQLGIGTNTPNSTLTVNSTNDGTGTTDWIASNVGGTAGDRVVSGVLNGKATIGGHTNAVNAWADITINPTTTAGATVTIGNDANVAPTSGTDAAGLNTKLIVNGHIRQGYYQKTVSLNAGTQTTITWTHNLNYGPIVMMSTDQNGGGANMVDVTYTTYNNNANQTVFVLKNNGSGTATGTFRWIVVN